MKYNLMTAYAMDFASFLIQEIKNINNINNIILFGSVSREDADKNSDVDIFVDLVRYNKNNEEEIKDILDKFLLSTKYKNYWKPLGMENDISLKIGILNEWKQLKPSIISSGIALYGKFKTEIKVGKYQTFFVWENITPNHKRVMFNKQIFGYKQKGKFYVGLLQKYNGERLGKGCIIIPLEHTNAFCKLFRRYKVNVKIKKVLEY